MTLDDAIVRIQTAYPRVYHACHAGHRQQPSSAPGLTAQHGMLLAHLSEERSITQSELAAHLGVAKSTLSEALSGLVEQGFIERTPAGRSLSLRRTSAGTQAMSRGSVLETSRLRTLLDRLSDDERRQAVAGLELLAQAQERRQEDNHTYGDDREEEGPEHSISCT